ncbi:MAG: hypothetical protein KJ069_16355 [Anaerolineae bacterium]|nr:hypothetical protein [Anaerolineae bacterium]
MNKATIIFLILATQVLLLIGSLKPVESQTYFSVTELYNPLSNPFDDGGYAIYLIDINDSGQSVGISDGLNGDQDTFIWTEEQGVNYLPGDFYGFPRDINNLGEFVGIGENNNAFLWSPEVGEVNLGNLGYSAHASRINELGQVIGSGLTSLTYPLASHSFFWSSDLGMVDLGTLGGDETIATDFNNLGQVVGYSNLSPGDRNHYHAFLWSVDTGLVDLGVGDVRPTKLSINDLGQVVYIKSTPNGDRSYLWNSEQGSIDMGTLGGSFAYAFDINNVGQVVGNSSTPVAGEHHLFLWTQEQGMIDLGIFDPSNASINEMGQIAGLYTPPVGTSGYRHAFFWSSDLGMTDLDTLLQPRNTYNGAWHVSMNNLGEIVVIFTDNFWGDYSAIFKPTSPNQPPSLNPLETYSLAEGSEISVNAVAIDPEETLLTYTWDLDNDGEFESSGQTVIFSAAQLDGPSEHVVTVLVTDIGGLTDTSQTTISILNVAPIADFEISESTLVEGESATVSFSEPYDPSIDDSNSGFFYSYDCSNDGTLEASDVATVSYVCEYPDDGAFTARGRIKDKDGDFTDYAVAVEVLTVQQAVESSIDNVQELVNAGVLNQGQGNALLNRLEDVIDKLNQGQTNVAINRLQAFINQVNGLMNAGVLSSAEGLPLIDAANRLIGVLNS